MHSEQSSQPPDTAPDINYREALGIINSKAESLLTEREYLTILALSKVAAVDSAFNIYVSAFLRHTVLLSNLPISDRSVEPEPLSNDARAFLTQLTEQALKLLQSDTWAEDVVEIARQCDVADLVDGNLFSACLHDQSCGIGPKFQLLVNLLAHSSGIDVTSQSSHGTLPAHGSKAVTRTSATPGRDYAVLPFSNSVFEEHLRPVKLSIDHSGEVSDATSAMIFREVSHWHNSKRLIDPKSREDQIARTQKQQFYARRRNQWFMAEMMAYAASLTNAVGKVLEPEIITSGAKNKALVFPSSDKEENTKPKTNPKSGKKAGATKKQTMIAEIAASKARKDEATSEKILQGWRIACKAFDQELELVAKYQKTKQYLSTLNTDLKRDTIEAEVRLYLLHTLLLMWIGYCREDKEMEGIHIAALIFDSISAFSKSRITITKTIVNYLNTTVKALGLPTLSMPPADSDRTLSFNFALENPSSLDLSIPLSAIQFQLDHCGPYFERSIDSAPDSRVPFEPDAWQRKVLDEIDARRSLLVVAPTSAGKTFISFYAMKQVLESNDDDVLVYVAPTKALVNQIAAEVQARFSKSYKYAGNSVWGIHTRDYRINNPNGCQILVTVPHILQIMLLAPSNAKSWSERVKWIIFDEVHCIGQAEDGLIWEQLLLLAPCPIIALSATIGNPKEFNAWLASTQKAIGNDLQMVQHPHRYSDLRKFVYSSTKASDFQGLSEHRAFAELGLDTCKDFTFIHPVASLVNRARGMPDDFSLEARDCFTLWQSMKKHQRAGYSLDKNLDPSTLPTIITKVDIIRWEAALKAVLRSWIADTKSPYEAVFKDLNHNLAAVQSHSGLTRREDYDSDEDESESESEEDEITGHHDIEEILPLLNSLHEQDALPGIIFNYDRGLCERICRILLGQLQAAEISWKSSSPKWKTMLQSWEAWKKAMAKVDRRRPPKASKKGGGKDDEVLTKADLMRDTASSEASPWASFDPDNPVDGFHFADSKKLSQQDLEKYMKELIRREVPQWQLDGLRRGIGVHHAGMNRKYRQVVEMLFRKGFLRVVIATGTLALGINMPCKTVVFSGDSVFLTALNYRQAAGRAGRRGFDMLGNVVFHGISPNKIRRLISSRLPDLNGHFPITTTLVLRLFTLLNESKDSPFAIRSVNALLSQPRLYLGGEESKMTVLHHLRFSIEYLRRQYLLDSRGAPLNFAGCVSHLYFTENSSFAFHALLKDGYFHELCSTIDKNPDKVLQELMLTMAHLFGRQYCRKADEEFVQEVVKKSPSVVFLPSIPEQAAKILRAHNKFTLEIFTAYVQTFVNQHVKHPDDTLPLTELKIGGTSESLSSSVQNLPRRAATTVRSSFVALSGHSDNFDSIHDLCRTVRSGVFLEEAVVPYVGLYPEESELPLNAYLYDFFNHGDVTALAKANRIRSGDVWFVLNDFSMVLATIITSLSNFMNLTSESDLDFADVRGEGDEEEERREDKFLPDDSGYETASTASMATSKTGGAPPQQGLPIQIKKKKKVAESWDDDADEEDFQDEIAARNEEKNKERERVMPEKPAWEEGAGLLNVLKAFRMLREEFDTKFRAMWA